MLRLRGSLELKGICESFLVSATRELWRSKATDRPLSRVERIEAIVKDCSKVHSLSFSTLLYLSFPSTRRSLSYSFMHSFPLYSRILRLVRRVRILMPRQAATEYWWWSG